MELPFAQSDLVRANDDVTKLARGIDLETNGLTFLPNFPRGWCSAMSYVLIHVLEQRQLGSWTVVNGQSNGVFHDWLEYRVEGEVVYSIDATQHQFSRFGDAPYIGPGRCPAADVFTIGNKSHLLTELPASWVKGTEQKLLLEAQSQGLVLPTGAIKDAP